MTPDTGEKRRVTRAFFDTYVEALRERGWLDRVWARLPGDESTGAEAVENRKTGYFWHRLAPDLRRHWTFNGLHWGDPSEERKMATLQDADYATDIFSVNPVQYLGYPRLRRFLGDRSEREVSWYLHHRIHINQEPLRTRLNFWQMWQRDVRMVTLWNTTLWDTGDQRGSVEKRPRGFIYKSRWFGNGVLFWPGEEEVVPSRRADLLRDGIEDYGYFRLLQQLHEKVEDRMFDHPDPRFAVQYALDIPGNIVDVLRHRTEDPELVKEHRRHVARLIQKLQDKIQEQ